jgi:hypothetical protein
MTSPQADGAGEPEPAPTVRDLAFGWSPLDREPTDAFSGTFFPTMDLASGNRVQRLLKRHAWVEPDPMGVSDAPGFPDDDPFPMCA